MEIAVGIAQIIAAVVAVVALVVTSRSRKDDADRAERALASAERAAERAEAASALSIDQLTRIATSVEALGSLDGSRDVSRRRLGVAWSLRHQSGDTYVLENEGELDALDVKVAGHESLIGPDHMQGDAAKVAPHEALTFMALRTLGTSDSTITVGWSERESQERREWRYPLPPRPPRR